MEAVFWALIPLVRELAKWKESMEEITAADLFEGYAGRLDDVKKAARQGQDDRARLLGQ